MEKTEITIEKYVNMNSDEKKISNSDMAPGSADVRIEIKICQNAVWSRLGYPSREQILKVADAVNKMVQGKIEE